MERLKTYAILALLICCLGLAIYAKNVKGDLEVCQAPRPQLPEIGSTLTAPAAVPIIDTFTDAAGRNHAVISDDATKHLIRKEALAITSPFRRIIDSQARALAIKPKEVESYLAVQLKAVRDSVRFLKRVVAQNGTSERSFEDKYVKLRVRDSSPADTSGADSLGGFDLEYNADLSFVEYSKQKRFLGIPLSKKRFYTDISSSDPRMKIRGVEKFTIQRSEPAFGLRVQALSTYNFETQSWGAGVGTRFDIGDRFNVGINYLYNFNLQKWVPAAYAKYDILQIGR